MKSPTPLESHSMTVTWEWLERVGRPRPTLMLALLAVGLATALREFTLTSALLCLLGVSVVGQAFGTRSGLLFILPCAALLYGVVIPLNPVLIPAVSTGSFVLVSSAFCLLQGRLPAARRGESRALALVALSRHLSEALREDEVWDVLEQHLQREFGPHRLLKPDQSAKGWAITLPDGLGSVVFEQEPEERQLAEAFLLYAAQAVGRLRLAERMREADLARAREKLHSSLLNSISHDLRTPLVSIKGAPVGPAGGDLLQRSGSAAGSGGECAHRGGSVAPADREPAADDPSGGRSFASNE